MSIIKFATGFSFESANNATILDEAIKRHYIIPYSCKTGRCGASKCKLIHGDTKILIPETGLTEDEKSNGWILSCSRSLITDLFLEAEDLSDLGLSVSKNYPCKISSLEKLSANVIKVILRLPAILEFNYIAGQYVNIIGLGGIRRSYSLASAPKNDGTLELHVSEINGGAFVVIGLMMLPSMIYYSYMVH